MQEEEEVCGKQIKATFLLRACKTEGRGNRIPLFAPPFLIFICYVLENGSKYNEKHLFEESGNQLLFPIERFSIQI